ncbi:MAG: FAD binding domain-containing protein [Phycisphaerales bacterium]|nr:FAD binding domain-containing protein [Planctomycetota bacterium]
MPQSLREACAFCAEQTAIPMAGATDLLVHWPIRPEAQDKTYLDLSAISELRPFRWTDVSLHIGALTTYWDILRDPQTRAEFPLLHEAARQVGAIQIQSRGTWAGNIANGSPAADGVPVLLAYDASVVLTSMAGSREIPLREYYTGYRNSVRRSDELITSIILPRRRYDFSVFHKVGARRAQAITKVGIAVTREAGARAANPWRVVASSVAATVRRCPAIEAFLASGALVRVPSDFFASIDADIRPIDDIRSTASYRRTVLARLLYHSLRGVSATVV